MEASAQKIASSVMHDESQNRSFPSSFFYAAGAAEVSAILPPNRSYSESLTAYITNVLGVNYVANVSF